MRRIVAPLLAAATIAISAIATPTTAEARWGWGPGPFFGGLAAGALIAGAFAPRFYGYPVYYGRPAFYGPGPYCWRPVWTRFGYRRVWVC